MQYRTLLLVAVASMPLSAVAQQVPGIETQAISAASVRSTPPASVAGSEPRAQTAAAAVPATMPPPVHTLSPSAPLNAKERASAQQAAAWRNRTDRPARGEDGVLRWVFGASLPSVVCSPLQTC